MRLLRLLLLLAPPLTALHAVAGEAPCPAAEVREIAPGVYLREGAHGLVFEQDDLANIGFIVGTQAVAVIDSGGSPAEGEALLCAIRDVTALPVTHLINTHVHPDHVFGNQAFHDANPDVTIVGHANLPRSIGLRSASYVRNANLARGTTWSAERIVIAPTVTTGETMRIDLGGRELVLTAHRTAHTDSDLSVLDLRTSTLWTGDLLFRGHLPVIDGSVNGWIDVLEEWLRSATPTLVVPGHGPIGDSLEEALAPNLAYLKAVRTDVRDAVARGDSIQQAQAEAAAGALAAWQLAEHYHRRNVAAAYVELEWE